MRWTNLFSLQGQRHLTTPHNWDINLAQPTLIQFQMSSLPRQGTPYDHQENLGEHQGWKQSVDGTYPKFRGCFSNGAWQLSPDKLLWSVQKPRTKEDKFCAVHKPLGNMSAQSKRPNSPVAQAWAWTTFPGYLLAKSPCAFCMLSLTFLSAEGCLQTHSGRLTYWPRQASQNKHISVAISGN